MINTEPLVQCWGFPGGTDGKEPACHCRRCKRHGFDSSVRNIPWRRAWQPTPVFLPGESHGQWSLVDHSPQGRTELDTTEVTQHAQYSTGWLLRRSQSDDRCDGMVEGCSFQRNLLRLKLDVDQVRIYCEKAERTFWVERSSKNTEEKEVRIYIEIAVTKYEEKSKIQGKSPGCFTMLHLEFPTWQAPSWPPPSAVIPPTVMALLSATVLIILL